MARRAQVGRGGWVLGLLLLPGCAGSLILGFWLVCMAGLGGLVWLIQRVSVHFQRQDREVLLGAVAQQLALPAPEPAAEHLLWTGRHGLRIQARAGAHLELRIELPDWLPHTLVVDTIAPPVRGLGHWVPDPRLTDWVASGSQAELLGLMGHDVRDGLLEAHNAGPGPGICIRRGSVETSLAWADTDALLRVVARLETLASIIHALPQALVERLYQSACYDHCAEVQQASLHAMQASFARHPRTLQAERRAQAAIGPGHRTLHDERGRLALVAPSSVGQLSVVAPSSAQGVAAPKTNCSSSFDPISAS